MMRHTFVSEILEDLSKHREEIILEQLNELISRNLLVIELTQMTLTQDYESDKLKVSQGVRLVLKDQEYIEKLEKENSELKLKLETIRDSLKV